MVVEGHLELRIYGAVHQPQPVRGPCFERRLEARAGDGARVVVHVGAVDQRVLECGRAGQLRVDLERARRLVAPVVEEDVAEIDVVVGGCGAVDLDACGGRVC